MAVLIEPATLADARRIAHVYVQAWQAAYASNEALALAHASSGYSMAEVARAFSIHWSTVSRAVVLARSKAQ